MPARNDPSAAASAAAHRASVASQSGRAPAAELLLADGRRFRLGMKALALGTSASLSQSDLLAAVAHLSPAQCNRRHRRLGRLEQHA